MHTVTYKQLHIGNAFLARVAIEQYDATVNRYVPWPAGTTVTVSYCRSADGTNPIAGLSNLPMAEVAGAAGTYALIVPSSLLAACAPYDNQVIFQVVRAGSSQNMQVVTPLLVMAQRYAQ